MAYKIERGELGFDVIKDDKIWEIGFSSRESARRAIKNDERREANLRYAVKAIQNLRESLRLDYGLSAEDVSEIFKQEARQ